jgi:hypothetical protein
MNKELEQAIEYFKNRNSFEVPVYDEPQFKTILKYYQIVYENWQECESELKELREKAMIILNSSIPMSNRLCRLRELFKEAQDEN